VTLFSAKGLRIRLAFRETEVGEPGQHLGTDRRLDDQGAGRRMRQFDPARVKLQFQGTGQGDTFGVGIFRIAQDRMAYRLHVGPQLVCAAGMGPQGHPGGPVAGATDGDVLGLGRIAPRVFWVRWHDQFTIANALFDQGHFDDAFDRLGRPCDDRPVGLQSPPLGEGARQPRRRRRRLAQ